ncbi:hypothetical protein HY492_03360 [Candidatus Woesearchaeota archaeon]|nr:hypothetical protein [Candidatus Woesearchaeota archaeon]
MPAPEVIASIQRMRSQGYSPAQIHQSLISSGYSSSDADRALRATGLRRISWFPAAAGIGGGLAVIIIIILIVSNIGPAFTMKTVPQAVEARAGSSISFGESFEYERSIDAEELVLRHELISPATGNLILQIEQRVEVADSALSKVRLPDDLQPGRYVIKTVADADGHTAESSFSFKVLPSVKPASLPNVPAVGTSVSTPEYVSSPAAQCNDFDACTNDHAENGACFFEPLPVCCGDYVCDDDKGETTGTCSRDCAAAPAAKSSGEIVAEAETIAGSDANRAELLCGTLAQTADADQCYDLVARKTAISATCGRITTDATRDSCYLSFAINNKQFDVCTSITNPNLQSSCYSFKNLAELQTIA